MGQWRAALRDVDVAGGIVRHDLLLELDPATDKIRYVRKIPELLYKPGNLVIDLLSRGLLHNLSEGSDYTKVMRYFDEGII